VRRLPVGRLPMGRLPVLVWTLVLYAAFFLFSNIHSVAVTILKFSFLFFLLNIRRSRWAIPLTRKHWQNGRSDVRGFPDCILRGDAASGYVWHRLCLSNLLEAVALRQRLRWSSRLKGLLPYVAASASNTYISLLTCFERCLESTQVPQALISSPERIS
jgi:hypothetical protein